MISWKDVFSESKESYFNFESPFIKIQLSGNQPKFTFFSTDSLGDHLFANSPLLNLTLQTTVSNVKYDVQINRECIAYYVKNGADKFTRAYFTTVN